MPVFEKPNSAGGRNSIQYAFRTAKNSGGFIKFFSALNSPNTCKTCGLGKGGIKGGLRNEMGQGFQVCKKSMQAQAQDMLPGIPEEFFKKTSLRELAQMSGQKLEALGRLINPLYLPEGADYFQPVEWSQAYEILLKNWQSANPDRSFFYSSGRSSNEAVFLIQLLARQWGTNNINNCAYYCHQASGVGLTQSLGVGVSTIQLDDLQKSDVIILIGANPASNHPRLMKYFVHHKRRGGKVLVINPFKELGLQRFNVPSDIRSLLFGSNIADYYIQPHCGGDLAFIKAAIALLFKEKKVDTDFLDKHCNNLDEFQKDIESQDIEKLLKMSGVSLKDLQIFCDYLNKSKNTIFAWGMGITQQLHGVESVRMIANLALTLGMVGKEGAGLLPLRGHSNVQGVATVGAVPQLKKKIAESLMKHLNIKLPPSPGKDTFSCIEAASKGEIDFALLLGGNLYGASPHLKWTREALNKINFIAFLSPTLNSGHVQGGGKNSLILPVRARDEEKLSTSQESMFSYVRLSLGGSKAPSDDLPSETDIFAIAGKTLLGETPVPWSKLADHKEIRKLISITLPKMHSMAGLDSGKEFTIPGRVKHTPNFSTENEKANLAAIDSVDSRPEEGFLNLMTFRSEGQFNTIVYEEEDLYRGAEHRMVVFMNKNDISNNGFSTGKEVWVESEAGKIKLELLEGSIRAGNAAVYFPEANIIVPGKVDPQSRTPAFKRVSVRIYKAD